MELLVGIIAAFASVVAAYYAVRNDKAHIKKCIRKKEQKINQLELQKDNRYYKKYIGNDVTPEDEKIEKLKQDISDLKDRL